MARLGLQRWGYIQPKALEWLTYNTIIVSPLARSFIQGVLPPLLLPLLFVVLPFILRGKFVVQHLVPGLKIYSKALAWYECIPRYSMISVSVYRRFYIFLLVYVKLCYLYSSEKLTQVRHGFLIVTLSAGITRGVCHWVAARFDAEHFL